MVAAFERAFVGTVFRQKTQYNPAHHGTEQMDAEMGFIDVMTKQWK
jgi:hypothetical protein